MSELKPVAWAHMAEGKVGSITYSKGVAGSWDATGAKVTPLYAIPKGYALVPVEPTDAMVDAGYESYGTGHFTPAIIDCYKAMIKAAQESE